jgi:hypothetical protein
VKLDIFKKYNPTGLAVQTEAARPTKLPAEVPVLGPGLAERTMELRREECRLLRVRERAGRGGPGEPGLEGQVEEARARLGRARDNRWVGAPSALPAAAGCVQFPRLVRASACRLVQEEDTVRLYYSTENTREYKEVEEQFLEVSGRFCHS